MAGKNRIVVSYDYEDIVLLGAINTKSGEEMAYDDLVNHLPNCNIVNKYDYTDYTKLKTLNWENKEGFVVKFTNGDRCKIKFEDYLRLHKIMTEISAKSVWECLSKGDDIYEMLKDVPDEFFKGIDTYIHELTNQYITLEREYNWIFNKLRNVYFVAHKKEYDRAEFAQHAKGYKHPQILFKMLDDKDPSDTIWRIIKPEYKRL